MRAPDTERGSDGRERDPICPWCYLGKRRLQRALSAEPGTTAEVHWRAFQLNPDMPVEGVDLEVEVCSIVREQLGGRHLYVVW